MIRSRFFRMRASLFLLYLMVSFILLPGEGQAQRPFRGEKRGMAVPEKGLRLTEEQREKLADMRLSLQKEIAPLRARMVALRTDLKLLLTAETPDMKKIEAKQKQISEVQSRIQLARLRHQLEVRALLTPEQRKLFDARILSGRGGPLRRSAEGLRRHRKPRMPRHSPMR